MFTSVIMLAMMWQTSSVQVWQPTTLSRCQVVQRFHAHTFLWQIAMQQVWCVTTLTTVTQSVSVRHITSSSVSTLMLHWIILSLRRRTVLVVVQLVTPFTISTLHHRTLIWITIAITIWMQRVSGCQTHHLIISLMVLTLHGHQVHALPWQVLNRSGHSSLIQTTTHTGCWTWLTASRRRAVSLEPCRQTLISMTAWHSKHALTIASCVIRVVVHVTLQLSFLLQWMTMDTSGIQMTRPQNFILTTSCHITRHWVTTLYLQLQVS